MMCMMRGVVNYMESRVRELLRMDRVGYKMIREDNKEVGSKMEYGVGEQVMSR